MVRLKRGGGGSSAGGGKGGLPIRAVVVIIVGLLGCLMLFQAIRKHHELHHHTTGGAREARKIVKVHHSIRGKKGQPLALTPRPGAPVDGELKQKDHRDDESIRQEGEGLLSGGSHEGVTADGQKIYRIIESSKVPEEPPEHEFLHPHSYTLNRTLMESVAKGHDNTVVVTWVNFAALDFALNWVANCKQAGITNYLVGAMDGKALAALAKAGVPTFAMRGIEGETEVPWEKRSTIDLGRHKHFHGMGREKIHLITTFVDMGFHLVLTDSDTVWLKNPAEFFAKYPEADILCSSDITAPSTKDGGLELPGAAHSALNIGVMLVRATDGSRHLAATWLKMLLDDEHMWDQNAFNMLVRQNLHTHYREAAASTKDGEVKECEKCATVLPSRVFAVMNGQATVGILPVTLFAGGHHYFVARLPQTQGVTPYIVHATFQFSGNEGKRHRLREAMLWVDPPEYYDHPRGYLTYKPYLPAELLERIANFNNASHASALPKGRTLEVTDTDILQAHLDLVRIQLLQLRQAVHTALALARVLVLPKLVCGLDRWWAPHAGVTPGAPLQLPFECPLDHVVNVAKWYEPGTLDLHFREHSFLDNPRTPNTVKQRRQKSYGYVTLCGENKHDPGQGVELDMNGRIQCPTLEREDGTRAVLDVHPGGVHNKAARSFTGRVAGLKVVEVTHMATKDVILWEHQEDRAEIDDWFEFMGSSWCCVKPPPNTTVGHVHYDMLPDLYNRPDRHGFKRVQGKFVLNLGP